MPDASYKSVKVKIGDVEFYPQEARYVVTRAANQVGRRIGESIQARAYIKMEAHDVDRLSQDSLMKLWKKATDAEDKPEKVTITYYQDDKSKVLGAAEFTGWISVFETYNPSTLGEGYSSATPSANNMLRMEVVACLDNSNVSKHKFTK